MSTTVLTIGVVVFLAHFLALQFRRTHIPDVLVLVLLGIVIGPLTGVVEPQDFGKVGSVLATIALVVILFESGTALDLATLGRTAVSTVQLTLSCFVLSALVVAGIAQGIYGLELLPALMLGATLGGTASAVVIPLVATLRVGPKPGTVLVMESALTDVLCIVGVFALLQAAAQGQLHAGQVFGSVLAALVFAAVIGVLGGIAWLFVLGRVRGFPNTLSSTLAFVFIVYGATEFLGFSGAIAALALGVTLTNHHRLGLDGRIAAAGMRLEPLTAQDLAFFREAVFLLKTYFFVYLGISIRFGDLQIAAVGLAIVVLLFLLRLPLVRWVFRAPEHSLRDAAIASMMAPKGLAAAVLASLPLERGVAGGEVIRDLAYMVVVQSIALTALLVMLLPLAPVQRLYGRLLGKPTEAAPQREGPADAG
ncbi:MAG: cation:proton antiporter [Burkholderiaceae bacterium]|nr:cation:proton antiporter [Burkholderiaceae bacterium]